MEGDLQKTKGALAGKLKSKKMKSEKSLSSEGLAKEKVEDAPPLPGEYHQFVHLMIDKTLVKRDHARKMSRVQLESDNKKLKSFYENGQRIR